MPGKGIIEPLHLSRTASADDLLIATCVTCRIRVTCVYEFVFFLYARRYPHERCVSRVNFGGIN